MKQPSLINNNKLTETLVPPDHKETNDDDCGLHVKTDFFKLLEDALEESRRIQPSKINEKITQEYGRAR
jgi:hypothetical protein